MSFLVLAIDTTQESGSLALVRGTETLDEVALRAPTGFAHVLYGHIGELLRRNGLELAAVDCFAAASGPGSFTGVRVGLACVKGLAEALGKSAAAVSNLRAMASFGAAPLRAVVLDARRGEVYGAVYSASGEIVMPELVSPFPAWLASLREGELEFVVQGYRRCPRGHCARSAGRRDRTPGWRRRRPRRAGCELRATFGRRAALERYGVKLEASGRLSGKPLEPFARDGVHVAQDLPAFP